MNEKDNIELYILKCQNCKREVERTRHFKVATCFECKQEKQREVAREQWLRNRKVV